MYCIDGYNIIVYSDTNKYEDDWHILAFIWCSVLMFTTISYAGTSIHTARLPNEWIRNHRLRMWNN